MITKIELTNFKSHAHTVIEPGRVTALVGPNGCGKTSVLQAVYASNRFVYGIDDWGSLLQFIRNGQAVDGFRLAVNGLPNSWGFVVSGANIWNGQERSDVTPLAKSFGKAVYFKAIAKSIALPSYTTELQPVIDADGNYTASVISELKNSQEEIHERIEADLQEIVPVVKRIRVHRVPKLIKEKRTISANGNTLAYDEDRQVAAQELLFDTNSGEGLPASFISEGTLVTLALLTLLHTSDASVFLLDDVEQGLHPLAQRQLMQVLKNFAEKHDRQIILTSHSPYIIDELDAKDVWVMATDKGGITHTKRLSDHPDAEKVLSVLTTGEFASAYDEEWVLGETQPAELVHG